jgi:hypothetical protein
MSREKDAPKQMCMQLGYLENAKYLARGMHGRIRGMQIKTLVLGKINNSI